MPVHDVEAVFTSHMWLVYCAERRDGGPWLDADLPATDRLEQLSALSADIDAWLHASAT